MTDALTQVANRRAFNLRLEEECKRAERYKTSLALLLLDVDYFKSFNDTFGHPAGDEVLRSVASLLKGQTRKSDFMARYGGEEFAIILPNTEKEGAFALAERFRQGVADGVWYQRPVTVSIGVCALESEQVNGEVLLCKADKALYQAKKNGRNCTVLANSQS